VEVQWRRGMEVAGGSTSTAAAALQCAGDAVATKQQDDDEEESRRCRGGRGRTWLEAVGGRVGGDSGSSGKIRSGLLHPPIHVSSSRSPSPCSHSCFSWLQGTEEGMNESQ
jgi:hypothetical protein